MEQNELTHYGILGMKWGVRRTPAQLARARGKSEDVHDDYTRAHSSKSVKSMSNQELRETNNRLQMEKQYSDLTRKQISAGKKFVTGVLTTVGTQLAVKYVSQYAERGVKDAITWVTNVGLKDTPIRV